MDLRRGFQHEYGRSKGADGGGYGAPASSSGRAIPPTAVPSLSTGQGFYTVESLQGATMVPPPQPAPPPPRLLPPLEPHARHLPPPRRLHLDRGDFGPYERRYPPPPAVARKMMMAPPPDMPYPRRGEGLRGPGMLPHRPPPHPPFFGDPRMPGFFPGRNERPLRRGWGPGDSERHSSDYGRDRKRPSLRKRMKAKKQAEKTAKTDSQSESPSKGAADRSSSADERNPVEGGPGWCAVCKIDCLTADSLNKHIAGKRHKKQVESQVLVEKSNDKAQELKEEDGDMAPASQEAARPMMNIKGNEGGEDFTVKDGELDHKSVENVDVEAPKGDDKSETTEPKSVAGKKRAVKDVVTLKKKSRKSAALSNAPNATTAAAVKGSEDATNADKVLQIRDPVNAKEVALDGHVKGIVDVSTLKTSAVSLQLKGDGNEPPTSEMKLVEELSEDGDGLKEVRGVTDLESGRTGQSAEVQ